MPFFPFLRSLSVIICCQFAGSAAFAQQDSIHTGRFVRGTGTNASGHSFVIAEDFQKGLECGEVGGLAPDYLPYLVGQAFGYHYNATNPASLTNLSGRIPVVNPIAAFGSPVGGSPLYIGQNYRYGVFAGEVDVLSFALTVTTWTKTSSNLTLLGAITIDLPYLGYTSEWFKFQTNGFTQTFSTNGLTTIISYENVFSRWGADVGGTFRLTHIADASTTNKIFQVAMAGLVKSYPMVATGAGQLAYSALYTLEFEKRPPWRSMFIDQPHFAGEPLPPAYIGKTVDELLTNNAVTTAISLPNGPTTYTNLDHSPELRRHPILDQFVTDMRRDPIALARYVQNEISVTDAISYNDNGSVTDVSINSGGVARGALATFLEGQGSPTEQCALLVYLLRQSGTPAVFVYPPDNQLKLLDTQLSQTLRMQMAGAVNDFTQPYTTNRVVPVNYPWVAAYNGTNWVHIFPWLKDTEIVEGLNLYDYMPTNYNNGFKWLKDYAYGRTNILSLATTDDTPLGIFGKFVQNSLQTSAPGISLDDIGVSWRNRPNSYARWQDFPKPWVVPTNSVALDSLSSSSITNVYAGMTNIFDTVSVEVSNVQVPARKIFSGEMRLVDVHNRRLIVRHEKTGANLHDVILSLAAFRTNATGPTNFTTGHALLNFQQVKTNLTTTGQDINIRVTYKRHRSLPSSIATNRPTHWVPFPGLTVTVLQTNDRQIKRGDLAAICFNFGTVTRAMLNVHAQELWNMERLLTTTPSATNTISADLYQGGTAYLTGMAYYERNNRFRELNERLHKQRVMSEFACGLSYLTAKRAAGVLPGSGNITLVQPKVDMNFHETVIVGNHTIHPDSGADSTLASENYRALQAAELSAEEHRIINSFYRQDDAISTIKLLQLAQKRSTTAYNGMLILNVHNYTAWGNSNFNGTLLKNHDAALWSEVTSFFNRATVSNLKVAFVTPGAVTNYSGSYKGMGALLWSPYSETAALIGANLNGGVGEILPDNSFVAGNMVNYSITYDADGNFVVGLVPASSGNHVLAPDSYASYDAGSVATTASQNYFDYTSFQNAWTVDLNDMLGLSALGSQNQNFAQGVQNVDGNSGYLGFPTDGLSQNSSGIADPVHAVTGEFYVSANDLTLPGPMPLRLNRNYSSLNLADNQFGYGWKLDYMPYLSLSATTNIIYAAEPDGAVIAYERTATNVNLWLPSTSKNPQLNNNTVAGMGSTANRFRNRIEKRTSGPDTFYDLYSPDGSRRIFKVTTFNGGGINRTRPYLTTWHDNKGNSFTFEYGQDSTQPDFGEARRIQSSNGSYLGLRYDVYGHIIEAYTGDGRRIAYQYDQFGDLVSVTLPDATEIGYEYEHKSQNVTNGSVVTTNLFSTHLITKEIKSDGRVLVNAFDSQRRVTNQLATVGPDLNPVRNATFIYSNNFNLTNSFTNTITGYTLVIDVNNKTNRYDYSASLITNITDQLGRTMEQSWYADNATPPGYPRSLWKTKDKRGLLLELQYDVFGNVTNSVRTGDLLGTGTTLSSGNTVVYDTNNLPLEVTDPIGNKIKTTYSAAYPFLPSQVVVWGGGVPVTTNAMSYYNVTNTFVSGGITYTNAAFGLLQQQTRATNSPHAAITQWFHDGRGFPTQEVRFTGMADPSVISSVVYNDRGELVERTDAAGRKVRFQFDGMGRPIIREVFDAGQSTASSWEYSYFNQNGELTWSDGPQFDPEDYIWRDYDGAGRLTTDIHWRSQANGDGTDVEAVPGENLYATTFRQYDNFGNLIRVTNPRGAVVTNIWDAAGQMIQRKFLDVDGATVLTTEGFSYEPGGLIRYHTNALGGVTETQYTSTGQPRFKKSPTGATNGWTYYLDGRLRKEIQNNGAFLESTYNDAARTTTRIFYSVAGSPLATNVTEIDRRGNIVRQTDAAGFVSTNLFDGLDRLKVVAGPAIVSITPTNVPSPSGPQTNIVQQIVTTFFDAAGIVTTNVNALGEKTITSRDPLGRPTRTEVRSTGGTLVRESETSYAGNFHGWISTEGSGASAIDTFHFVDHAGREVITSQFSSEIRYECTINDFDIAGNLTSQTHLTDTDGIFVAEWAKNYAYDGLNRVIAQYEHDDALTLFQLDPAGNLTNRVMPGGLKWQARYNNAGQLLTDFNVSSTGTITRSNNYAYYSSGHPFAGLLQTRADGRAVACTHTYDDYLRPVTNAYSGSLPEHSLSTSWQYDVRGLIKTITESFASTNTGPSSVVTRSYDPYRLVLSEGISLGGISFSSAAQSWDSAGRRGALGFGGFGFSFGWYADGRMAASVGLTGGGTYSYDTAGQLVTRAIGPRVTTVHQRDGVGRPLSVTTLVNSATNLSEALTWTSDGLLATHSITRADYGDQRSYAYANLSRRLTQEILKTDASTFWTNSFTYDNGTASGPGVLTRAGQPATSGVAWKGGVDTFSRINAETNSVARRAAYGKVNGPATVTATLGGKPVAVTVTGTNALDWRATLEMTPGSHQLIAIATHPSGQFTTNRNVTVTNNAADRVEVSYNGDGQLTQRVWRTSSGLTNRTQNLSWDAKGRLYKIVERDSSNGGKDFSVVYDALNRRLRTTEIVVTNGVSLTSLPIVIAHYFDPSVEFLEMAVVENGRSTWKLMGPDLNGVYGGGNGVGGFDAIIPGPELFCPTIADIKGNLHGVFDPNHNAFMWNTGRVTGYGAVPGNRPVALGTTGNLVAKSAWRNRPMESVGYTWLGGNWYDPESGRFISPDPYGHIASVTMYEFCGGDPINRFDYSGRDWRQGGEPIRFSTPAFPIAYGPIYDPLAEMLLEQLANRPTASQMMAADQWNRQFTAPALNLFSLGLSEQVSVAWDGHSIMGDFVTMNAQERWVNGIMAAATFIPFERLAGAGAGFAERISGRIGGSADNFANQATQLEFNFVDALTPAPRPVYPPNYGFLDSGSATMVPGSLIDRFGENTGRFAAPAGTPYTSRSLPPGSQNQPYSVLEVLRPFDVQAGPAAPWFGEQGFGIQYQMERPVQTLIDEGYLRLFRRE